MRARVTAVLPITALFASVATTALAQATSPAAPAPEQSAAPATSASPPNNRQPPATDAQATVAEIVVTAQKRSESISKVGMAITAATGQQLKELGVRSVGDLTRIEPSFVASTALFGTPVYTIRGVGYNDYSLAATPTVSVYQDEAPYALLALTKGATFDLNRVEVLKGPQGTLFGQNATGGAVNYIAAKPTDSFQAGLEATGARFGAYNVNGFVSGPITSTLKGRLAFDVDEGGGYQQSYTQPNRNLGDQDLAKVRGILEWTPTEKLKLSLNMNGFRDESEGLAAQLIGVDLQLPSQAARVPVTVNYPIAPHDPRAADWYGRPNNNENFYQSVARADYTVSDSLVLTYLGSYSTFREKDLQNNTGENVELDILVDGKIQTTSQELRASGKLFDNKLEYVLGGNYARTKTKEDQLFDLTYDSNAYALTGLGRLVGEPNAPPYRFLRNVSTDLDEAKAVFGNAEYHITDTFDVHAGLRYTQTDIDHSSCSQDVDGALADGFTQLEAIRRRVPITSVTPIQQGQCVTLGPQLLPQLTVQSLDQDNVSWRVGVDWTIVPRTLLYATISKGYKSGSFPTLSASTYTQYAPATQEELLAYEVGVKSRLRAIPLELNGSVFYYDYTNKQAIGRRPDPNFGVVSALVNIPHSEETGAEFSAVYRPINGLTLNAAVTYIDSRVTDDFDNYTPFGTPVNLKGEAFPNTPRFSGSVGARYDFNVNDKYAAYVAVDGRASSKTQGQFGTYPSIQQGFPSLVIPGYGLLNLRFGVDSKDGHWHAQVFGNNVTNTYYVTQALHTFDDSVRYVGPPATYGVTVGYRF